MPKHEPEQQLSQAQARRIAVDAALLGPRSRLGRGSQAVLALVDRLGYVQIDSIAVVNRAHHHTVWSRLPGYCNGGLYEELRQRRVFEYWGHAASFMPIADYPFYRPLMRRFRDSPGTYTARRMKETRHLFSPILRRIEQEGPLSSSDFGDEHGSRGGSWWHWKPAKIVLELLLWQGALMVSERRGFQRVYDLTERVLPDGIDNAEPPADEVARFIVWRALRAYGLAREKDIRGLVSLGKYMPVSEALTELLASGEISCLTIVDQPGQVWYMAGPALPRLKQRRPRLHVLSPFDNLVIQRDRLLRLFGFEYTIECYVPAAKRVYGYFSLPLLWGDSFVGRMDAKAHRDRGELELRALHLEDAFSPDGEFFRELATTLRRYAAFNGCQTIRLDCEGRNLRPAQVRQIRSALAG